MQNENKTRVTGRAFLLGLVMCAVFAMLTIYFENRRGMCITASQIPVLPYVLVFITVLLINPMCRLIRVLRPFSPAEILVVFCMGLVSSGISTFGLSSQLVPFMSGLFNEAWNNDQSRWNQYVAPFVSEQFFVAEDGMQDAARRYMEAENLATADRQAYDAAMRVAKAKERAAQADEALSAANAVSTSDAERVMAVNRAQSAKALAEGELANAMRGWNEVGAGKPEPLPDPAVVVESYPERLAGRDRNVAEARAALGTLESKAFAKVRLFRRGLPAGMRAYPGMMPLAGEDSGTYWARVSRMYHGRRSWNELQAAGKAARAAGTGSAAVESLKAAVASLEPIREQAAIRDRRAEVEQSFAQIRERSMAAQARQDELYRKSRDLSGAEAETLTSEIRGVQRELKALQRAKSRLEPRAAALDARLAAAEHVERTAAGLGELIETAASLDAAGVEARIGELQDSYVRFDSSLRGFLLGDVPWSHWVKPLVRWGVLIGLTYVVLMAFNMLIFRQWSHNEKLIYPLAELTEHLAGAGDNQDGAIPAVFRSGLFWAGFAISACFLGWNLLYYTDLVPGLSLLNFQNKWTAYISGGKLSGLQPTARSEVFFTMVGLSFLIPKKISFSLWFFSIVYMLELLVLVWMGYGVNESSFECEWWTVLNFRTSQGGGAMLVFAAVVLFKCRRYLACCLWPSSIRDLERDEQMELRIASCVFLLGSLGIVLLMWKGMGANLWHTIFFCIVVLLITVGLIRAVTEGGILGFQAWAGPFHFIRNIAGLNKSWTMPSLFAPLMVYYGVLFLDIKTFIAPAMANALKIRSDLRIRRFGFHGAMLLAIALAMVIGVVGQIMMGYSNGADEMNSWFYSSLPSDAGYGHITALSKNMPGPEPAQIGWIISGAIGMAALMYFRQFLFWLPHPIGLIMLVNPIMIAYWFSILLGWLGKTLVTKYGNKEVYGRVRCLFLGLIVGEVAIVLLAMVLSAMLDVRIPIDLNRNAS